MSCKPVQNWNRNQRQVHWWTAGIVAVQFALQGPMREAVSRIELGRQTGLMDFLVTSLHVWGGFAVLGLTAWRWQLRRRYPVPVAAGRLPVGLTRMIVWSHRLMIGLLLAMVASGSVHWYVGWSMAGLVHELVRWPLGGLIVLHLAAACAHRWLRRDDVLQRMIGQAERR